jgi:hypothetical protein
LDEFVKLKIRKKTFVLVPSLNKVENEKGRLANGLEANLRAKMETSPTISIYIFSIIVTITNYFNYALLAWSM